MTFTSIPNAKREAALTAPASNESYDRAADVHRARVVRDLDGTSDAFVDAVNLLDRCLPPSFGA